MLADLDYFHRVGASRLPHRFADGEHDEVAVAHLPLRDQQRFRREQHGIAVVGYTPFGTAGLPRGAGGKALADIAGRHGATSRQVILAFLTRRASLFGIPKAGRVQHTEENAGAQQLTLSAVDERAIEAAFPLGRRRPGVAML